MKKVTSLLALVLCVLMLTLSFASCANMDKYEKNLGSDYEIEEVEEDEIEELFEGLDLDAKDYGVKKAISAINEKTFKTVVIFQCGSSAKAKDLAKELEDATEVLGALVEVEVKGNFVFLGNEDAIEDALDK
jgi:hypothetical protein